MTPLRNDNNIKMKNKKLNLILISLFVFTSCTVSNIHCLSTAKPSSDENYGFTKENPISINIKRLENKEKIVEEYISRLYSLKMKSGFQILKKNVIPNSSVEEYKTQLKDESTKKRELDYTLEEYTLITNEGKDTLKLYFNLNNKSKGLKYPNGFMFGQLSGK